MKLIDADEILKEPPFTKACGPLNDYVEGYLDCVEDAINAIENAAAVDAVPVVRCRECKYFDWHNMECGNDAVSTDHEGGASYSLNFYLDDFCSYGERRDDDEVPINR